MLRGLPSLQSVESTEDCHNTCLVLPGAVYLCDDSSMQIDGKAAFVANSATGDGGETSVKNVSRHACSTVPRLVRW